MEKLTDIRKVRDAEDLIGYFAGRLGWDIDVESFEDIEDVSYEFTAEDLGLTDEAFAKIRTLRQLRPFDAHQKWGMFCIEFDSRKFEVSALRKVLSGLIPRRRNVQRQSVWNLQDILFLCDWGEGRNRTVGLAHFEEHEKGAPQIKVISCTPSGAADPQELATFESRLAGLSWPKDSSDWKQWSKEWSAAFRVRYRETIDRSSKLTIQLADQARDIRDRILAIMSVESRNGYVHLLWEKFKATLIADMSKEQFADMYAQTMVYGLFSARCMDKTPEDFSVEEAIDCIPKTNPFLKNLMRECLGVRDTKNRLSFDELEIGNVVDLLLHTDMTEIVKDFNRQTGDGREDPVIHFYEEFLAAYDKTQKVQCGVFYTPQPVVNFIVRAVDTILKNDFGYADGLATTATKKIKTTVKEWVKSKKDFKVKQVEKDVPAVQILDPATGTGTFIRQTILQIYENFRAAHKGESEDQIRAAWNAYVPKHLLPRLNGFELMMAPYAVAHMKLAMVLKDTGYDFKSDKRLQVYLTNSLEEPGSSKSQAEFWEDPLAAESVAANEAKTNNGINIVIGNPPYSGISQNNGAWISKLVDEYKYTDGEYFNERKHWLNDDYVKFIRFGQEFASKADKGVLVYITNHAFLDNPTFRAMRWNLMDAFDSIYILNLHGNSLVGEQSPTGGKDENVFDIQQGVAISIFLKTGLKGGRSLAEVYYHELYGVREAKYEWLCSNGLLGLKWHHLSATAPYYFFVEKSGEGEADYNLGFPLDGLMMTNVMGVTSARDSLVVDMDSITLKKRIEHFADQSFSDAQIREEFFPGKTEKKYLPGDTRGWKLSEARLRVRDLDHDKVISPIAYRPFDNRFIYYTPNMVDWDRFSVMRHFVGNANLGICAIRINRDDLVTVLATDQIMDKTLLSSKDNANVFPLYLYSDELGKVKKTPNLDKKIVAAIEKVVGKVTPEDVFHYVYAVLHTPEYRAKYKEFLKIDFPRIPYPKDATSFRALVETGAALVATHLLKSEAVTKAVAESAVATFAGATLVDKPTYVGGAVCFAKNRAFENVPETAWNFYIGGYQPAQKWLKDRKGRTLSEDDVQHYRQIIHALCETDRLMKGLSQLSGSWM